jgi:transcriptional/translational regulatory protein YebC/TACO1
LFRLSLRAHGERTQVKRTHCIADGGSVDPEKNVAPFNVIKNARAGGVPKANIESALQKVLYGFLQLNGMFQG